jgi:hypothetical protein
VGLGLLSQIITTPAGIKACKKDVFDVFHMESFFQLSASSLHLWKTIINATFSTDKDRFLDLLSK